MGCKGVKMIFFYLIWFYSPRFDSLAVYFTDVCNHQITIYTFVWLVQVPPASSNKVPSFHCYSDICTVIGEKRGEMVSNTIKYLDRKHTWCYRTTQSLWSVSTFLQGGRHPTISSNSSFNPLSQHCCTAI